MPSSVVPAFVFYLAARLFYFNVQPRRIRQDQSVRYLARIKSVITLAPATNTKGLATHLLLCITHLRLFPFFHLQTILNAHTRLVLHLAYQHHNIPQLLISTTPKPNQSPCLPKLLTRSPLPPRHLLLRRRHPRRRTPARRPLPLERRRSVPRPARRLTLLTSTRVSCNSILNSDASHFATTRVINLNKHNTNYLN